MPNARTHDTVTLVTGIGAAVAYLALAPHADTSHAAIFAGCYLFAGYACAGDLDLNSREYRRWGPLRFVWWPYRALIPHRSRLSHGLLVGGIFRILYLLGMLTLLSTVGFWAIGQVLAWHEARQMTQREWSSLVAFVRAHPTEVEAGVAGFVLAGTVHSLTDALWSGVKRAL